MSRNKKKTIGGLTLDPDLIIELDGTLINKDSIEGTDYILGLNPSNIMRGGNKNNYWIYKSVKSIKNKVNNKIIGHIFKFEYMNNKIKEASIYYNTVTDQLSIDSTDKKTDKNTYLKSFDIYIDKIIKNKNIKNNKQIKTKTKFRGGLAFDFIDDITDKHEIYYSLDDIIQ
jgi:hypothetical protein